MARRLSAMACYIVHCSSSRVREKLLQCSSEVLFRASERHRLRLLTTGENDLSTAQNWGRVCADAHTPEDIDVQQIQKQLRTKWMGGVIVYTRSTASTQDILRTHFPALAQGTVALTALQLNGRGRRGTCWESPVGSVCLSVNVRMPLSEPGRLTFLQYIAALAVVDAVKSVPEWSCITVKIKWPNDVYVHNKKVGGVLCECSVRANSFDVTVGVGVNVCNAAPTTCLKGEIASALGGAHATTEVTRELFVTRFLQCFEMIFDEFERSGTFSGTLLRRYLDNWMHTGQKVRLEEEGITGTIEGLSPAGHVRVRTSPDGLVRDLPPDLTSLDLAAGVLKAKQPAR